MFKKTCHKCEKESVRLDKYDAYACIACNVWLESKCSDELCTFCPQRPENPKEDQESGDIIE